jgi:hypothetical protein
VKAVAAVLILLLGGSVGAPLSCAGWETSAGDRQACCKRAHHDHCQDQSAADDCCAKHQSARLGTTAGRADVASVSIDAALIAGRVSLPLIASPDADARDGAMIARVHVPPGFLSPPLRI